MSQMMIQIDTETLHAAITDLTAKISDLSEGSNTATRHFEALIGSDGHPDITPEERVARLVSVRDELSQVAEMVAGEEDEAEDFEGEPYVVGAEGTYGVMLHADVPFEPNPDFAPSEEIDESTDDEEEGDWDRPPTVEGLSEAAMVVLSDYAKEQGADRLEGPHVAVGKGVPSAFLYQAAAIARGQLTIILNAIMSWESGAEDEQPQHTHLAFFEAYEETLAEIDLEIEDDLQVCHAAICYFSEIIDNLDRAWSEGIEIPRDLETHVLAPLLEMVSAKKLH